MGNKEDKAAQRAAANAEVERLCELPVPDLAAMILPAWGFARPPGPVRQAHDVAERLMAAYPHRPAPAVLAPAVEEAIQVLEHAGLLIRTVGSSGGSSVDLTRLGWAALADGTVRRHLPEHAAGHTAGRAGLPPALQGVPASVVALARARKEAYAIERYRELTGADLKYAASVVHALTEFPAQGMR